MVAHSSADAARVVACDSVGSTSTEALSLARAGERGPLWVTARRQEAGRGRLGRTWASEPGNLYASLLLTEPSPAERAPQLSFVAALAAHDAVSRISPALAPNVSLKWPNDVLLGGRKCGGILVEAERCGGVLAAVIGIGVNCAHHPENTRYPATDLSEMGAKVLPDHLFPALQEAMAARLEQWDRGARFDDIRRDWLVRALGLDEVIQAHSGQRKIAGKMKEIDRHGQLVVELADGTRELISAGEITAFSGPPAAARAR
jgi:BirA family biotin operon repressor/biotin-[acetyl-CoA-carboxylase] ligase